MESILGTLVDSIVTAALGVLGLAILIAAIIGIPYMVGIGILRLPIKVFTSDKRADPWLIGLGSIGVICLLWLIGTTVRGILKL